MKKVKFMMLSLALIAIIGGALAFKAKGTKNYCTALPDVNNICTDGSNGQIPCPSPIVSTTVGTDAVAFYCYTLGVNCDANTLCRTTSTTFYND